VDADFGLRASQVETIWGFVWDFTHYMIFGFLFGFLVERVEEVDSLAGFAG